MLARSLVWFFVALVGVALMATLMGAIAVILTYPTLPGLEVLTDYRPKIPLRIYTSDGIQIGEFGEERRSVVKIADVPPMLQQAILAAEDERFYQHRGVDYLGVLRAAWSNFVARGARQGASTITMQVARNFFLTKEKTLTRKFNEALLAFKIESNLTKDEILELYVNQIYLGQRAYGFAAAAQTYFGKPLKDVTLAEAAMLAGLPKAPSRFNPVVNPKRAKTRQQYVLRRMLELGYIDDAQLREADKKALHVRRETHDFPVHGEYLAEMVRQQLYERYQEEVYSRGFKVYTTAIAAQQEAAYRAVRKGAMDYDRRHGYRGPEAFVELKEGREEQLEDALQDIADSDDLLAAVVTRVDSRGVRAYRRGGEVVEISGDGLRFVQKALSDKAAPAARIRPGAIIRIQRDDKKNWQIVQLPQVEAALVALDPESGAVKALVGGVDFERNKFNHITQAWRQPGSSFKPFIYSAALEKGFTPATVINDAPLVFDASQTGSEPWEPRNYDGKYEGPMRLRTALAKSRNLVSIRILQAIGPRYAQDYLTRFGFDPNLHPPYLTMALGAGSVTPMQQAVGYSVFANEGYRVAPYFIERIEDEKGSVIERAAPVGTDGGAERVIDPRNAFLMTSLMQDVVRRGTATKAMSLGRTDLAGKTGTTNDFIDAWFCGYQRNLAVVAWIGFDKPRSLGQGETGAQAALPMWISFMSVALKGVPDYAYPVPEGVVAVAIGGDSGLQDGGKTGLTEYFYQEFVPKREDASPEEGEAADRPSDEVRNQLF